MRDLEARETLRAFGWDDGWERAWGDPAARDGAPGRVVARHRDRWLVATATGERSAVPATGVEDVAVGDWVALEGASAEGLARMRAVLPRRTAFVRKAAGEAVRPQVVAANVDTALVVAALADAINARRLERYAASAWESGATPLLVLTKADVPPPARLGVAVAEAEAAAPGVEIFVISAATGQGMDELRDRLGPRTTAVLLGPSGAGKSTLANALLGEARFRTAEVLEDGRGRHTTTHRELVRTPTGVLLIDTPGMRELGLWGGDEGVDAAFPEIEELADRCRFRDCAHASEPGCAVLEAVAGGRLDPARVESWRALRREVAWLETKTDVDAAARAKARTRALHRHMRRYKKEP